MKKDGKNMVRNLLQETDKFKYVSFDLFDTLMFRIVSKPELIFDLVEQIYNESNSKKVVGFKSKRLNAEKKARKRARHKEITIDRIYSELSLPPDMGEKLEKIEKDIEAAACMPNRCMVSFLDRCRLRGQAIIITTDMYLDRDTIERILKNIGVNFDVLFISCEEEQTKLSGELFEIVLERLQISADDICHIGDNFKTDFLSPKRYGIAAFERIVEPCGIELYTAKKKALHSDLLNTFVENHLTVSDMLEDEQSVARIGYSLLGPLIYSFCKWLHEETEREQAEHIAFVAREGYFIKRVYDEMYPSDRDKTDYIRLNKNMIRLPALHLEPTVKQFVSTIPYRMKYTGKDIAALLFAEDVRLVEEILVRGGFSNKIVLREDLYSSEFGAVWQQIMEHTAARMREQFDLLIVYLQQMKLLDGTTLLVNNSINGSAQKILDGVLERAGLEKHLIGVQFMASEKCRNSLGEYVKVWFDREEISSYEQWIFSQYSIILEHLLFEMNGTADYLYKSDLCVEVKCELVGAEKSNEKLIGSIQEYALRFIRDIKESGTVKDLYDAAGLQHYIQFLLYPKAEDALLIGTIVDSDYDGVHKLFDVQPEEELSYREMKNYRKIKWQHGYLVTIKDGDKWNKKYDMEKRIKYILKHRMVHTLQQ